MRSGVLLIGILGVVLGIGSNLHAQRRPFTSEIDRGVVQAMMDAQQAVSQKQYLLAVQALQSILDHPEDYFLRRDFSERNLSYPAVRGQTQRILAELPVEAREAYEREYGATARVRLNEAISADNLEKVAEVVQRFQMTAAGWDAMCQLSASCMDHDDLLQAALIYEAMIDHPASNRERNAAIMIRAAYVWRLAGQNERSVAVLENLRALDVPDLWRIDGKKVTPYKEESEAAEWMSKHFGSPVTQTTRTVGDWNLPRGGPSGNESASLALPAGGAAWTISPLKYSKFAIDPQTNLNQIQSLEQQMRQVERSLRENNRLTQPAAMPLVVDNLVVMRTLNGITAIDLQTGDLRWRSSINDQMLSWMFQLTSADPEKTSVFSPITIPGYLRHKLFSDQLSGSLSSDGRNVYVIEGAETQFNPLRPRARQRFGGPFVAAPTNKLVAYDLQTGRIAWEVGGLSGTPPAELSGIFFLGPPLPYGGRLYCLAEVKHELCLIVLTSEPAAAQLDFGQTLIALNPLDWIGWPRRHAGLVPAIADQIMVCSTATGSIVGYDLMFRQLRWGYSYDALRSRNDDEDRQLGIPLHGISFQIDEEEGRWIDGGPVISAGRVIVTPRDSNEIHCLNLVDGSLIWKRARGSGLFVACVQNDAVYVVGKSRMTAYSLSDGSDVWQEPLEISEPSGKGVRIESRYLLPLSTGDIVTVDLQNARILGQSRLPDGRQAGNLAIGNGTLVLGGIDEMTGFHSLQQIQGRIRDSINSPDNSAALALRGELRLHHGEEAEAINDLRQSLIKRSDPQVKQILAGTLLNIVRKNPGRLRELADELNQLTDAPGQKVEFLRLYAASLQAAANHTGAIQQLFRLAEIAHAAQEPIVVGPGHSMSVEQSVKSELFSIYDAASHDERREIENAFERQLKSLESGPDKAQNVSRFVKLVAGQPAAQSLLLRLIDQPDGLLSETEQFQLLERFSLSENPAIAGPAVARLAERSLQANQPREARPWIDQLGLKFAAQVCLADQTGQQLAAKWLESHEVREAAESPAAWPEGPIDVERSQGQPSSAFLPVEIVSRRGRHFEKWSFEIDPAAGILQARDDSLKIAWQLEIAGFRDVTGSPPCLLHIRGHRLACAFGPCLVIMEARDTHAVPDVLFENQMRPNVPMDLRPNEFRVERRLLPTGRRIPRDARNPIGYLVGISDEAVFYQLDNRLNAIDLESGRIVWSRVGPPYSRSDAAVDQLLTLHTDSNDAVILRPLDGILLQQHKGNRSEKIIWYGGTRRLTYRQEGTDQQVIEMRELDGNQSAWKSQHPTGSLSWIMEGEEIAILEPSGKLSVLAMDSGQLQVTAELPVVRPYGSGGVMAAHRYGENYVIVAGVASRRTELLSVVTLNSDTSFSIDGHVTAINRQTGRVAWTAPVEQQSFDFTQPTHLPVLVLAAQHLKNDRTSRRDMARLSVLILDKQSGRTLYSTQEPILQLATPPRFVPMVEEHKLLVDFQSWKLAFAFSKPPEK